VSNKGRPRKISSVEQFEELVDCYLAECREEGTPVTWTGLALYMGFHGRDELSNYADYDGFSGSVKRAKTIIEHEYEKRLYENNPTGAIFALKNLGWSDKQEVDNTSSDGSMSPQVNVYVPDNERNG